MNRSRLFVAGAGFLLACSLQASTILYNNTGNNSAGSDLIQTVNAHYDSISTGANSGSLSRVALLLVGNPQLRPGTISVGLFADNGTTPGSLLASLGTINDSSVGDGLFDLSLTANPFLNSGTRYWIGLSSLNSISSWYWTTDTSGTGIAGEFFSVGGEVFANAGAPYQMEVEVSGVPEPSTLILGASTLATLFFLRRRRIISN